MKKIIISTLALCIFSLVSSAQDFRNANWFDSPDEVRKKEVLPLLKDNYLKNNLESLTYVEFTGTEFYFTYYYLFYSNKLIGARTKTAYLTKENSRFNILILFNQTLDSAKVKHKKVYEDIITGTGLPRASIILKDTKIFIEIKEEGGEYYLLESILRNKITPVKKR